MEVTMDFLNVAGTPGQGEVAQRMQANKLEPGLMRPWIGKDGKAYVTVFKDMDDQNKPRYQNIQVNAATLRREEWMALDEAIVKVAESRLVGIADLVEKGLVYNLANATGTTVLESHTESDAMEAELSMDGVSRTRGDRTAFGATYLPIPIIHSDFDINARILSASRNLGNALDVSSVERAARRVAERLEQMLFTNLTYNFGGGSIFSYINFPHRNTHTITAGWLAGGKTAAQRLQDVLDMKQKSINSFFYGPWMLYVPTVVETLLDADYDPVTPGTTLRERILKIGGIQGVKVVDTLPANSILLVQMTTDVVRLVRGMGIQTVQWNTEGNFLHHFKVLTIQVPQIRADFNNRTGIVHGSWA